VFKRFTSFFERFQLFSTVFARFRPFFSKNLRILFYPLSPKLPILILLIVLSSCLSILFLSVTPPEAENPPILPLAQVTLWQAITSGSGFFANTPPTALAAPAWPP